MACRRSGSDDRERKPKLLEAVGQGGQLNIGKCYQDRRWRVERGVSDLDSDDAAPALGGQGEGVHHVADQLDRPEVGGDQLCGNIYYRDQLGARGWRIRSDFVASHSAASCYQGEDPLAQLNL